MKVHLRQNPKDLIPTRKWCDKYEESMGHFLAEGEMGDAIIMKFLNWLHDRFAPINKWWKEKRTKKIVEVHYEDIWSADHTLALIIVPVLKKLKEHKHGSPNVDLEDVPDHLRSTKRASIGNTDDAHHERWDWVLDEMIWAFEQELDDWQNQYLHNIDQLKMNFTPVGNGLSSIDFEYQADKNKPKFHRNKEGIKAHSDRMANGRRLFAKYYQSLWD